MKLLIFLFLISTIFVDALAQKENLRIAAFLSSIGYTKIPIIKKKGSLYINGTIEKQPIYCLLDTGSTSPSILSDSLVPLKLTGTCCEEKVANMTGGITYAKKVSLPLVTINDIQVNPMVAKVTEQPFKNDLSTIVLGNDFFEMYNAIIDIGNYVLYLNCQKISMQDKNKLKQLLEEQSYQQVPLTKLNSGHIILPIQINNAVPAYFLLDTGTSETTLSDTYVASLASKPLNPYQTQIATDGTISIADIILKSIIVNPLQTFFQKPIALTDCKVTCANISAMSKILGVVGIFGLAEMEKLGAIISLPTQAIYFRPHL